ncbi:MAG: PAS domain-containing protein [Ginsengibacter sp.]
MPQTPIDFKSIFKSLPAIAMILLPDSPIFTIAEVTDDLLRLSNNKKEDIIGKSFFHFLQNNPHDAEVFRHSFSQVISTGIPHRIELQRYDIKNSDGVLQELYWAPFSTPVFNEAGELEYIFHLSENITEKILSKKEAEAAKYNFEYYLANAAGPFAILTGRKFEFTFANEAYVELMNGRELVGKTLEEAIPEIKDQSFILLLQKVYDTGVPFHAMEIAATASFGGDSEPTTRYFNLSYTPIKDHNGTIIGILASGYDITNEVLLKNENEKQILNQEAYNLFMQAPVGFSLLLGDDHKIELVNAMALRFTGRGEESVGKPVVEVMPEIEKQGYIKLLDRVKRDGESFNLKESAVRLVKDGVEKMIYLDIFFHPFYQDEKIAGVLALFMNVSERVAIKRNVEEMRERFETMANNIPNLAWIANANGEIFWYNNRWYEYTGTSPDEVAGWGWQSVNDPKNLPAVLETWKRSLTTGEPFEMTLSLRGADKIYRPFLTRIVPIRDNHGKIIRWLGTNTDITKQKEVEKMKDDFISIASHELKTPLTTIKAYGQLAEDMLRENGDKKTLETIRRMGKQVSKLNLLIDDLLDVTKIQKGKLIYKEEFFDSNELLVEVIDDMQRTITTHKIEYKLDRTAQIFGDRNKIGQVINNLISNSIKYSPKANTINISTQIEEEGVKVAIQDFGIGIMSKNFKKIFTQFYRVSGENQLIFSGMGIGLFICREIVARHGGKIWLRSKIKSGSTFYIWLPFNYKNTVKKNVSVGL